MRLLELKIQDFGVYQGAHKFDLNPRNGPIVIFGGKNGAGKTTLFEAIKVCLYGVRALGDRVSQRIYDQYILSRFHRQRNSLIPANYASITLCFEYAQFGVLNQYEVTRAWQKRSNSIKEDLVVYKDGKTLTGLSEKHWQDFIEDVIPTGIANIFFFDGEKIQSLADDDLGNSNLGEEIKRLLKLDLIETLQADLDIYLYRQRKKNAIQGLIKDLEAAQTFRDEIEEEYRSLRQDRSQTQSYLEHYLGKTESLEREISRESGGFAMARDELKLELAQVNTEIDHTVRAFQSLAAGLLPFSLVPELSRGLKERLFAEARQKQWHESQKFFQSKINSIREKYNSDSFWDALDGNLSEEEREKISAQFAALLDEILNLPEDVHASPILHHLSEPDRLQLINWIDQSLQEIPSQARQLINQLEELQQRREEIILSLRKVPEDDVLKPLLEDLNLLQRKIGEMELQASNQDQQLRSLEFQLQDARRRLEKAYLSLRGGEALERRLDLVTAAQSVLDEFRKRLTSEKVKELEKLVVERFNDISRKPDLINNISIDPLDFRIDLYSRDGKAVSKKQLSAGEKQMLSIAILWALRQLSGRPIPIVVDTPLGRLDSDHRENLVEQFFPYVSHQVILFSTDTEVDQTIFDALKTHVSHAYHLLYDSDLGLTRVDEGYFWDEVLHELK
jgi:DNA sulfur modification protein DndD